MKSSNGRPGVLSILLGTVALRKPGQSLEWDAKALRIKNSAEAQQLLRRTYRPGWLI